MKKYEDERSYASKFEREIRILLADYFVKAAPEGIDRKEATDLMLFEVKPIRVACRVRRFRYFEQFRDEFTIRSGKPNGTPTELGKIVAGWGDYLFYGFADEEDAHLRFATLIDLKEFRLAYNGHLAVMASEGTAPLSIVEKGNRDGSSRFKIFRYDEFPDGLIARHWNFAGYYGQDSCLQMASGF